MTPQSTGTRTQPPQRRASTTTPSAGATTAACAVLDDTVTIEATITTNITNRPRTLLRGVCMSANVPNLHRWPAPPDRSGASARTAAAGTPTRGPATSAVPPVA